MRHKRPLCLHMCACTYVYEYDKVHHQDLSAAMPEMATSKIHSSSFFFFFLTI